MILGYVVVFKRTGKPLGKSKLYKKRAYAKSALTNTWSIYGYKFDHKNNRKITWDDRNEYEIIEVRQDEK